MIRLAGWIVGRGICSLLLHDLGRQTSSNFLGALSGHPIRSAKPGSRISLASAFRVLSAPPRYGHSHTRLQGRWSADHPFDAEPRHPNEITLQPVWLIKRRPVDVPGEAVLF